MAALEFLIARRIGVKVFLGADDGGSLRVHYEDVGAAARAENTQRGAELFLAGVGDDILDGLVHAVVAGAHRHRNDIGIHPVGDNVGVVGELLLLFAAPAVGNQRRHDDAENDQAAYQHSRCDKKIFGKKRAGGDADVKHVVIIFNPADLTGLVTLLYSGLKPGQVTFQV